MIERKPFGTLPTGQSVEEFTLTNKQGLSISIITYGGIVTRLLVPDRQDKPGDVVLGFNSLDKYLAGHPYFGCITGRVAGRITKGKFTLDGVDYALAINNAPNHLHGGNVGFDKRLWTAELITDSSGERLRLTYRSPDGEEGYPGNLDVAVTYSLTDANEWAIRYEARTDRATPVCLTNHNYYNLAGEGNGRIDDHVLQIFSDEYAPADEGMTLLGRRAPVAGLPNDFTRPRRVGDALPGIWKHHGDAYFIRPAKQRLAPVAILSEPTSGRVMSIASTEPGVQFYSGFFLDGTLVGKSGKPYGPHAALCLECQGYPDAVNAPAMGNIILRPGETYRQETVHTFATA